LIAVPATDSTQYLSLISALSRLAKNARLMEKLRTARDTCQMMEVMKQVELRTSAGTGAAPKGTPC
jgi:mannitol/fructose-specific phosphotransferase system IIA component (Ntr-type)